MSQRQQKSTATPEQVDYPTQKPNGKKVFRLVNRRTGRLASSTTWLIDLAAVAVALGDNSGIASLLPRVRAKKLIRFNTLKAFYSQQKTDAGSVPTAPAHFRALTLQALPLIAATYLEQKRISSPKHVTRKRFISWILAEINTTKSGLCIELKRRGYLQLVGMNYSRGWWEKLLKKTRVS